jgi:hypothetical protein
VADYAHVYLEPDESSPVIETLERGAVLSLLYSGKTKKIWYYICFKSLKTDKTKSGYVLDSSVEPLFEAVNSILIQEEMPDFAEKYAPRKFDEMQWGLTKKQVVELEGKPSGQEKVAGLEVMRYDQRVHSMDCSIEYVFAANKLSRTRFCFRNDYLDKNVSLNDYQKIKDALAQRFGRPLEESMNWRDATLKSDFSSWGDAVSQGDLELSSRWQTPKTEILASLTGKDQVISLTVEYQGIALKELARRSQAEAQD